MIHHRKRAPDKAGERGRDVRDSLMRPLLLPIFFHGGGVLL